METVFQRIAWLMRRIAEVAMFAMMCLTMLDVAGRYLFNFSLTGAVELTELLMVAVIFSGIALSSAQRGHVTVDLIALAISGRLRLAQRLLGDTVSLAIMALLTVVCWSKAAEVADYGNLTAVLLIPIAPAAYFMAGMLTLTTLYHLIQLASTIREGARR